ncbi:uncharacterized protein LOC121412689 [Lytechinus variegatus]|uniref:uncharacterized protein LOC121412689 n=1 Tax=Lytechinus variegatus TaxID=7654 RepID=UPI001BB2459D|nr:uncharacterized protein LOC121412689 [Lytechinus variegatus]
MAQDRPPIHRPIRVGLWCVPRSTSTVLTKCLSAIDGMDVYLEIYSYAALLRGYYSTSTGRQLPLDIVGNEAVYEEANDIWEKNVGYRMSSRWMSYHTIKEDLENANGDYILLKEMASNPIDPQCLPGGYKYTFLIRDPTRVYTSARKIAGSKYAEVGMISSEADFDLIRDDPIDNQPMKWYENQHRLWKYVKENIDPNPIVLDASDILTRPGPTIRAFCTAVGFPYCDKLLQLKPTSEIPNNFVTAGKNVFKEMFMYYERAFTSTRFVPDGLGSVPRDRLPDDVIKCVDHSMPFYEEMFQSKLCVL